MSDRKLWINSNNEAMHPNAPRGARGPGFFKSAAPLGNDALFLVDIPHPFSPVGRAGTLNNQQKQEIHVGDIAVSSDDIILPEPGLATDFPVPPQKRLQGKRPGGPGGTQPATNIALVSFVPAVTSSVTAALAFPKFVEGPPRHPVIHHDHGFLDDGKGNLDPSKKQPPTFQDDLNRQKWLLKLRGAQILRQDLREATRAYSHFLVDHDGTSLEFSYEDFARTDRSGRKVVESAVDDTRAGALDIYDQKFPSPPPAKRRDLYSIRTNDAIGVGGDDDRYPYPDTENWQKAIGAHFIWLDATVTVDTDPIAKTRTFEIVMTLHAEDMYNFNPDAHDIATGIPDNENGRFEIVGFGQEFLSVSTLKREIQFTVPLQRLPDNRIPPSNQNVQKPR